MFSRFAANDKNSERTGQSAKTAYFNSLNLQQKPFNAPSKDRDDILIVQNQMLEALISFERVALEQRHLVIYWRLMKTAGFSLLLNQSSLIRIGQAEGTVSDAPPSYDGRFRQWPAAHT